MFRFITLFSVLFASVAFTTLLVEKKPVNTSDSIINWKGYKVTGQHEGTIFLKEGNFDFEEGQLVGGSFSIDMNSITCSDLEGEWADKLIGHLKSDDFFGVANYPTADFRITKVIPRGTEGSYKIVGDLTIKDTTKEIKFNADVTEEENQYKSVAEIQIDRSEFDVKYGSGSFFDNLGDKTIYDEFDLVVTLVTDK